MAKQKLFFSYSRADGSGFAERLAADLEKKGFDVWIDQDDIKAGLNWDTEIEKALETCDCVLFLETEKSVRSKHVLDEVYYALEQNKKVIPLIFVDSKTPFRLNRLQHIDFSQNYNAGLALLVNELETNPTTLSYRPDENETIGTKSTFLFKNKRAWMLLGCIVVVLAALLWLTLTKKNSLTASTKKTAIVIDTATGNTRPAIDEQAPPTTMAEQTERQPTEASLKNKKPFQRPNSPTVATADRVKKSRPIAAGEKNIISISSEAAAGNWRLTGMEPKSKEHRGYLKIETAEGNKITVKSYMQFYYPDRAEDSYLTVFNAFARCVSCPIANEIKLVVDDIAIGSRTIKKLEEDQPDGRKAGDIILDASANKSLRGTATLKLINETTALLTVNQPRTVALSGALTLEPFIYVFRFKKEE